MQPSSLLVHVSGQLKGLEYWFYSVELFYYRERNAVVEIGMSRLLCAQSCEIKGTFWNMTLFVCLETG